MKKQYDFLFKRYRVRVGFGLVYGHISKTNALQVFISQHKYPTATADYRFHMLCFSLVANCKLSTYSHQTQTLYGRHLRLAFLHFAGISNSQRHLGVDND